MGIDQHSLRRASVGTSIYGQTKFAGQRTAFLSHSHKDRDLALGLQAFLRQHGVLLYIDWQDGEMPDQPSAETAQRLRVKIKQSDLFLFLATNNSMGSKWCPWELGNADGVKANAQIVVIPTRDGGAEYGAEYLHLYRRIDIDYAGGVKHFSPGQSAYGGAELRSL